MSKFIGIVAGAAEIGIGLYLEFVTFGASTPLTMFLISSGAGMVLAGIGSLLSQGPVTGTNTASRNPITPWNVIYGRAKVGGVLVFQNSSGESDKYLDLVFVLACHPSHSVDALLVNGVRVRLDSNGCSFTPTQQTANIVSIVRSNDTVTVTTDAPITDLETGDTVTVENVWDHTFNGKFGVTVIGSLQFSYISGGLPNSITHSGTVTTTWPDYKAKIHMETLLGNHTATFPGMLNGTPYDGDPSNLVTNDNNPWTSDCKLLGRTAAFIRLHYNDEIFSAGLPTFAFRVSGMVGIYDPRNGAPLQRPTVYLNGWGNNAHVGPYEEGVDQALGWGLNNDTTIGYTNPGGAIDTSISTAATTVLRGTHTYAGCIWKFSALGFTPTSLFLSVLSSVQGYSFTGRSAGIWYSLDGGTTWILLNNAVNRSKMWDNVSLSTAQDCSQIQVMAFTDAHDDIGHSVFDVRLGAEPASEGDGYTENAALCLADYLANTTWGFKAVYGTEIPIANLSAAANICDEAVPIAAGGTEPRYACNGTFQLSTKRGDILQNLLTACAGRLTCVGGVFGIYPGAWQGVTLALGSGATNDGTPDFSAEGMRESGNVLATAAGPIRWRPAVSIHDLYNGVKGTYVSPANQWQASDIPPYAQDSDHGYASGSPEYPLGDANLAADGGDRRWLDIQLPFTISCPAAQRLCKIELMRRRQQQTGTLLFNLAMYQVSALDVLTLTLPFLGFNTKLFEILAFRFTQQKQQSAGGGEVLLLGTEVDVQETDPSIYDWSASEELTAQDTQQTSSPASGPPSSNNTNYSINPQIPLSQPDATHIALAAVVANFPTVALNYTARSIPITDPAGTPTWYYITIGDPDYVGDGGTGPALQVYAETTPAKVGTQGFTYMGAIQCTHAAGTTAVPVAGGWPAPQTFVVGD